MFWLCIVLLLNYGISWWNAYVAGKVWNGSKATGGFIRLVVWCAAIQSAAGFSMVYTFAIGGLLYAVGYLGPDEFDLMLSFWYVAVVPLILGSGFVITLHSWMAWWRDRSLLNLGVSAYNSLAMAHNTMQAFDGMGKSFSKIGDAFSGDNAKSGAILIVLLLVLIGILAGVLHTVVLIQRYAGTVPLPETAAEHGRTMARP